MKPSSYYQSSPKQRLALRLALRFAFLGLLAGSILHVILGYPKTILHTTLTFFLIGFINGLLELFFAHPKMIRLPYAILLLLRSVIYFLVILILTFVSFLFYIKSIGYDLSDLAETSVVDNIKREYLLSNINAIWILSVSLIATIGWQLQPFFGKGVLLNYLTGKYHKPSVEVRIFMFLDLNDSTTIAEQLGPSKYSALVTDFFRDIDTPITETQGSVLQYVGDEVVVIWKQKYGIKNNNCLRAFNMAQEVLKTRRGYYEKNYGVFPGFKAGMHIGEVSITEVGVSKKEIAYHGNTINTTARVCAAVHKHGKQILISKPLFERLKTEEEFEDLGHHLFKGKQEAVHIFGK
ncbi:adenylate/guanylate cyclase domain-containing protein [Fulvivirgaceae bacterium BMA12]|uniref:Adenylate/guanylate cyclase domain-containing protein n=1 Tax=Agaribacillus aureus TaxID=3051825 RepID=A0ABT8LI14_9BACT|nr:adenylate/guanylate cyclase domain-containing protein [Fulvivirgaceae bacterium BMA12]